MSEDVDFPQKFKSIFVCVGITFVKLLRYSAKIGTAVSRKFADQVASTVYLLFTYITTTVYLVIHAL